MAALLPTIREPSDLRGLGADELRALCTEIRDFLVEKVCRTGGHLGPNLGIVEITLALHRVFDSPHDRILWDTGHQAYVHKMLTGRQDGFDQLRQAGGLSGYPSRHESAHDVIENSHASTALSYADGLAKAYALRGEHDRAVVAVVGDGALTGGMCWEALNNIAGGDRPVVIVVNDNGRSYAETVGGFAAHLAALRLRPEWESAKAVVRDRLPRAPLVGPAAFAALRGLKAGVKEAVVPQVLFEDLGLKYVGPVDGHDVGAVETALRQARSLRRPVVVHCVTRKGRGYAPAETDDADCLHGVGKLDPATGQPLATGSRLPWTSVFAEELLAIGRERPDVVAVTAAMLRPVGLHPFACEFPGRVFDVGIAEQHAVTSAAGLAMGGMHPVVCVYATFLNRAFDQMLLDVALHRQPVTVVLDRAGVTGDDGPSHHGMWDLSLMALVPGVRVAAPRDATRLRSLLREALGVDDGPTVLRFPKAQAGEDIDATSRLGGVDILRSEPDPQVLLVAVGPLARDAVQAAALLALRGLRVTVVDPRWVVPVDPVLPVLAAAHRLVVTVEDGGRHGGVGSLVAQAVRDAGVGVAVHTLGLAQDFLAHGQRGRLLAQSGLDAESIASYVVDALPAHDGAYVAGHAS